MAQLVKNLPAIPETWVRPLSWEDPLEKGKATYSSILAWRILWTMQSMGCKMWDTTERLSLGMKGFPGGSGGEESVSNAGDPGSIPVLGRSPGIGNGNPFQYSCLENPIDRGAWWAAVHGVAKSWT